MKIILSFIDWYLPGYRAGGTLKAFANQVAHLEGIYHFRIITRNTDYCETTPYDSVKSNQWNRIAPNAEVYYLSADNTSHSSLKKLVNSIEFDSVYIHGIYSLYFSILPILLSKKHKPERIVVTAHGMLGKHSLSVKGSKKKLFIKAARFAGLYKGVVFHAANKAEADDVQEVMGGNSKVIVAEELPMKILLNEWKPRLKSENELRLVSVARISPEKNTRYALEVLLSCKQGNIIYDIFGPVYEEGYWNECLEIISKMPDNIKVNYHGSLPGEQVLEKLSNYHLMFMPTTGENFGHTILESFMAATPVLISNKTPWLNLSDKKAGWDIPLNNSDLFVQTIEYLAALSQDDYNIHSQKALELAQEFMNDKSILKQNIRLFENE